MTWGEWFDLFNGLFGCASWKEVKVHSWINNVFVPGGMAPEELRDAALTLARGESLPKFPQDVMQALLDEVRQARVCDLMAREDQERRGGAMLGGTECRLCGGTGLVSVPWHPQPEAAVAKGYLATHAACCKCSAGQRMAQLCRNSRDDAPLLLLSLYERDNPGWEEQVRWWTHHDRCEGSVGAKADEWARLVDKLLKTHKGRKQR